MAILNPNKRGYAVLEINQLASRTTGAMIADAPLATDFTCSGKEGAGQTYAENGMILTYDAASTKGNERGAIVGDGSGTTFGLVYATEHFYNDYQKSLQDYRIDRPFDGNEAEPYEVVYGQQRHFQFYPRLYTLAQGDKFTTDAVDLGTYTIDTLKAALEGGTKVYASIGEGYSKLTDSADVLQVAAVTTLPDGLTPAIKFIVVNPALVG